MGRGSAPNVGQAQGCVSDAFWVLVCGDQGDLFQHEQVVQIVDDGST